MLALLAVVGFKLFPQREITVLSNGQAYNVSATFDTERDAVAAANVQVQPGDRVLYATAGNHASVAVERARTVTIVVDGQRLAVRTQASTIGGALADAGIEVRPGDVVLLNGMPADTRAPLIAAVSGGGDSSLADFEAAQKLPVQVNIRRARPVTVDVDPLPVEINTAAQTVGGVLAQLGITVREGDLVSPPLNAAVTADMTIRLAKARSVSVTLNGTSQLLYTQAATVADILKVLNVTLQPGDIVSQPLDTPVTNGMSLVIGTTTTTDEVVTEPVPPPTVHEVDASLAPGVTETIPGVPGSQTAHFSVTYKNGTEVGRTMVPGSLVITQPVPTRVITGPSSQPAAAGPASGSSASSGAASSAATTAAQPAPAGKLTLRVYATWYTAAQGAWAPGSPNWGKTYTGAIVDHGICAVDPNVIPLGTHFYVPGYGECVAADIGGGIKGYTIDLGFPESVGNNAPWKTGYVDITILD